MKEQVTNRFERSQNKTMVAVPAMAPASPPPIEEPDVLKTLKELLAFKLRNPRAEPLSDWERLKAAFVEMRTDGIVVSRDSRDHDNAVLISKAAALSKRGKRFLGHVIYTAIYEPNRIYLDIYSVDGKDRTERILEELVISTIERHDLKVEYGFGMFIPITGRIAGTPPTRCNPLRC